MPNFLDRIRITALAILVGLLLTGGAQAQLNSIVQTETNSNNNAERTQEQINNLAEQTRDIVAEFRAVVRETESLNVYNEQLQKVVDDQRREVVSINQQLEGLEDTNRGVVPLMLEMIATLEQVIAADIPFRAADRQLMLDNLKGMIDRSDVTTSEKYRRIMEAYQTELEYGRTTEAYSAELPTSGQTVDFLRVGRTMLFYQTADGGTTGWFNPRTREFEQLDNNYGIEVARGLSIAKNQVAPDLVRLPVPAPEAAQ